MHALEEPRGAKPAPLSSETREVSALLYPDFIARAKQLQRFLTEGVSHFFQRYPAWNGHDEGDHQTTAWSPKIERVSVKPNIRTNRLGHKAPSGRAQETGFGSTIAARGP